MITRDEAFSILKKYLRDEKLIQHSLAVEAILIEMAKKLGKNEQLWGLTGLLHDLDYEYTMREPEKHATISAQILGGLLPDEAVKAINAHNYIHNNSIPRTTLDKALIAADAASGLIIATALVMPSKTLSEVRLETLRNKFNDKSFAHGCNRNCIELCLDIGIDVESFLIISLKALQNISGQLGF